MSAEIRVHLDEQKVTDLKSAAVLADDYALTHKKSGFIHNKSYSVKSHWLGHSGSKQNPVMTTRGHLQKLRVTNLTKVKLNKDFLLSSRKDRCVFIVRKLGI